MVLGRDTLMKQCDHYFFTQGSNINYILENTYSIVGFLAPPNKIFY